MIFMLQNEETMPQADVVHARLEGEVEISPEHILNAYKDLKNLIHGVRDVISIIDGIADKCYTLTEVTYAGIILTDGLDGIFMDDYEMQRGKYIRINEYDLVVLGEDTLLFNGLFTKKSSFHGDDGRVYKFTKEKAATTTNSNRSAKTKTSHHKKSPKV